MRQRPTLVATPLFHLNGLGFSMMIARYGGCEVLLRRFRAPVYLQAIARHRCAVITSVPTMLALCLRETELAGTLDLDCVELVITGSAPSTEVMLGEVGGLFPRARVQNGWGATEAGLVAFAQHPGGLPRPLMSIGYPSPDVEVKLVGTEPDAGELWIRSPAVMSGYLKRPEETARKLRDGWYLTGDVLRRDADGFLYFVGRVDDMFVCGGENIYPGEVEKRLERHPAVAQAIVVPVSDPIKHQVPVAFVVPAPGTNPSEDEIKAFALANGPAYAHPRAVIMLAELPLGGTGKIDRRALTEEAGRRVVRT